MNQLIARLAILSLGLVAVSHSAHASDILRVTTLTDRILMVHFDDGYIRHNQYHEDNSESIAYESELDVAAATTPVSYLLTSTGDPNYTTGVHPGQIGRKSKPTDIHPVCAGWDGEKCHNNYILEHWIYLVFPDPLREGETYTLQTGSLAENRDSVTFTVDWSALRSEAVHVNQVGYIPGADKYGYVSHWMGDLGGLDLSGYDGTRFDVIDRGSGTSVYNGTLQFRKSATNTDTRQGDKDTPDGNFAAAEVYQCDFSDVTTPGSYYLVVNGIGRSFPFEIAEDVYRDVYYYTGRGLYYHRSGNRRLAENTGWPREPDHNPNITPGFSGKLQYTDSRVIDWPEREYSGEDILDAIVGPINTWGWYHDAGDWDSYSSHFRVPAHQLTVYEMKPENFSDGDLAFEESGNGVPDIIDEGAWQVRFYKRTKDLARDAGYATGGVPGSRVHGNFEDKPSSSPSYEDDRQWIVSAEDPVATYRYAALAAQVSYCYLVADDLGQITAPASAADTVALYTTEAIEAWNWAQANEGSDDVRDVRCYAASWLYKLTGNQVYLDQFKTDLKSQSAYNEGNFKSQQWAIWAYVTAADTTQGLDRDLQNTLVVATKEHADNYNLDAYNMRGWRFGGNEYMPMLIGQATTPWVIESIMAYEVSGEQKYLECVQHTADYFLGGNPLNMVWVTGLGERNPDQILHLDSRYDTIPQMIPGVIPYGPHRGDDDGYVSVADVDWTRERVYPFHSEWPGHEMWFENQYCPITNEYTVHQNLSPGSAVYGYLMNAADPGYQANRKPEVAIASPADNEEIMHGNDVELTVTVSDPDGNESLDRVEYFDNWQRIATATEAPWSVTWSEPYTGEYNLVARAYDKKGEFRVSDTVAVTVISGSAEPSVAFLRPLADTTVIDSSTVDIAIDFTTEAALTGFVLKDGARMIEESGSVSSPYTTALQLTGPGKHPLTVTVEDENGLKAEATRYITIDAWQAPYQGERITLPGILQVEHYDLGGEGAAYHDDGEYKMPDDPANAFREDEAVDAAGSYDSAEDPPYEVNIVTDIQDGEWMEYSVAVEKTGYYRIDMRAACGVDGSQMHLEMNGEDLIGLFDIPNVGWWNGAENGYFTIPMTGKVWLDEGEYILRLFFDKGPVTINYLSFEHLVNEPPLVTITDPEDGSEFYADDPFFISADASDDFEIVQVNFYVNGSLEATDRTPDYKFRYTPASGGEKEIVAEAVDLFEETATDTIVVYVREVGTGPAARARVPFETYPNPFAGEVTFAFTLDRESDIDLTIYDFSGRRVDRVQANRMKAGHTALTWKTPPVRGRLAEGMYYYRITVTDNRSVTQYHGKLIHNP